MAKEKTFTRSELYELAWTEPMKTLSGRFELSDVGLAKACKKSNIPRPPRGYWAKLKAGKKVQKQPLPTRGPGMSDRVRIGGGYYSYYDRRSEEEILSSNPQPPVFEDPIESVRQKVEDGIKKVTLPKFPERAHRLIRRLLEADDVRREKYLSSGYSFSWDKPIFDDRFEKRRLRILNAVFTGLEQNGMKPSLRGQEARELNVHVNDTLVSFTLDATTQKPDRHGRQEIRTRGSSDKLRLEIQNGGAESCIRRSWEDTDGDRLENHLKEIVVSLIVAGEERYRESEQRNYEWEVERKAKLVEDIHKRREEAERKKRERTAALEKARIERLLSEAEDMRIASDIRNYVAGVRLRVESDGMDIGGEDIDQWSLWALEQADRIDPVLSGRFMQSMDNEDELEDSN